MTVMKVILVALLPVVFGTECDEFKPVDCSDLYKKGETVSGIYNIYPTSGAPLWVYCDMISTAQDEDEKGGWTVIQRRMDGSVNFYRPWKQYKRGFGLVESEYWLGLENMYQLTHNRKYILKVDMEDFEGRKGWALYSSFSVDSECQGYQLQVTGFKDGGAGDALSGHNGMKFTTFDKDQDTYEASCARSYLGGFWYGNCHTANPNGVYLWGEDATLFAIGNSWYTWKTSHAVGMKSIMMKIKRVS